MVEIKTFSFFVSKIIFDMDPMGKNILWLFYETQRFVNKLVWNLLLEILYKICGCFFMFVFFVVDWKYKMYNAERHSFYIGLYG